MMRLFLLEFVEGGRRRAGFVSVLWTKWGRWGTEVVPRRTCTSWYSVTVIFGRFLKFCIRCKCAA